MKNGDFLEQTVKFAEDIYPRGHRISPTECG